MHSPLSTPTARQHRRAHPAPHPKRTASSRRFAMALCVVLGSILFQPSLRAAGSPANTEEPLFGWTRLWTIHLKLTAAQWKAMEPAERTGPGAMDRDYQWGVCEFEGAGVSFPQVAVRFKGNSSYNASRHGLKRPFRLDFNRDHKGRTWQGAEEVLLNNNINDATQFREALAYEVYRRAGVPAPRTAFARVYLTLTGERTNHFLGLYTLVEAVDGDFLKARLGAKEGLLLKPERLGSLDFLGDHWAAYEERYNPKTRTDPVEQDRFMTLTRLIDQADDATLEKELPARLDLDNFLRYLAVTALLANYDSFIGNGHNYYLFQPAGTGKALFIPWDLNEAFGGHPMAGTRAQQAGFSVLRPQAGPNRLVQRVLSNTAWNAAYRREVERILTIAFNPARVRQDAEQVRPLVQEAVSAESEMARIGFQRVALGQTNVDWPTPPARRGGADAEGPFREDQVNRPPPRGGPGREPPFPGPGPRGPGPGPGGPMGFRREEMSFDDWLDLRARNVQEELAGKRTGIAPELRRGFPGGPRPGPPPPGGPGDR